MKLVAQVLCVLSILLGPAQGFATELEKTTASGQQEAVKTASASTPATGQSYLRKSSTKPEEKIASPAQRAEPSLTRVITALVLIALLGGIAIYAKRRKSGGSALLQDRVRLHTIGSVQLGPKAQVALLSVGREAILVGVSEQGITCLRNYREDELGSLTTRNAAAPAESENIEVAAEDAFNHLLVRAAQKAPVRSEPQHATAGQLRRTTAPADEFTHSGFRDDTRGAVLDAAGGENFDEQIPPHLIEMLAQASLQTQSPPRASNVKPLRPQQMVQNNQFAEPEGQAAELMRRFSELTR